MLDLLASNWEAIAGFVLVVLGYVLKGHLEKIKWLNETLFFAFNEAERRGIADGWPGFQKLNYYIEKYEAVYRAKWGKEPSEKEIELAKAKANELSQKEKEYRQASDPFSQ